MTEDNFRESATSTSQFAAPLAAGTYLVGDPCYAFKVDHSVWMEWLEDAWRDVDANRVTILDGRVRGMRIAASRTAHGDGEYPDQDGNSYPVDAGLLGAVHVGFLRNLAPEAADLRGEDLAKWAGEQGLVVTEFETPFHVSFDADEGTVTIGHVVIDTDYADEDEDEAEEDPWS
jgi:hypothetical protein